MVPRGRKLREYVSKIDEACGEGREFIITLKYSNRAKAIEKMLEKCHVVQTISGILTKGRYKRKKISIFSTGKLVIKDFNGKEEAESFLEELFG